METQVIHESDETGGSGSIHAENEKPVARLRVVAIASISDPKVVVEPAEVFVDQLFALYPGETAVGRDPSAARFDLRHRVIMKNDRLQHSLQALISIDGGSYNIQNKGEHYHLTRSRPATHSSAISKLDRRDVWYELFPGDHIQLGKRITVAFELLPLNSAAACSAAADVSATLVWEDGPVPAAPTQLAAAAPELMAFDGSEPAHVAVAARHPSRSAGQRNTAPPNDNATLEYDGASPLAVVDPSDRDTATLAYDGMEVCPQQIRAHGKGPRVRDVDSTQSYGSLDAEAATIEPSPTLAPELPATQMYDDDDNILDRSLADALASPVKVNPPPRDASAQRPQPDDQADDGDDLLSIPTSSSRQPGMDARFSSAPGHVVLVSQTDVVCEHLADFPAQKARTAKRKRDERDATPHPKRHAPSSAESEGIPVTPALKQKPPSPQVVTPPALGPTVPADVAAERPTRATRSSAARSVAPVDKSLKWGGRTTGPTTTYAGSAATPTRSRRKIQARSLEPIGAADVGDATLPATRARRGGTLAKRGHVLLTSISSQKKASLSKVVKDLGWHLIENEDPGAIAAATHVVISKDLQGPTLKLMQAISICAGLKYVVTSEWLEASKTAGEFVAEADFLLPASAPIRKTYQFSGNLAALADRPRNKLFTGYTFFVSSGHTAPPRDEVYRVIEAGGGARTNHLPSSLSEKTVIIGCATDADALAKQRRLGCCVYSFDLIKFAIMKQQVEWNTHKLEQR